MDILDKIIKHKAKEMQMLRATEDQELKALRGNFDTSGLRPTLSMKKALAESKTGIISEFKRKSPSKDWIHEDADLVTTVTGYEEAGASALSILTDREFFGGDISFIVEVRDKVNIPILRKDFIIDPLQLCEARLAGADAVLLIAASLSTDECLYLTKIAHQLGLEVLLEIHSEEELEYINPDIDMVGVNNRNLGTFDVDVKNSMRIASCLPKDMVKVSESGISDPATIKQLREVGYRGFLIGETFMKQASPAEGLKDFIEKLS